MYRSNDPERPISELLVDGAALGAPTDEEVHAYWQGRGVFVSSVLADYSVERAAAIAAIRSRGARAIAWETITPSPVKVDEAWLAGVEVAHAFVLLLGARYGARRDDGMSATHAEFDRAQRRGIPRWVFMDARVADGDRDAPLQHWITDDLRRRHSYALFDSAPSLEERIGAKLDDAAAFDLFTWFKFGDAIFRADADTLTAPETTGYASGSRGAFIARGTIGDPDVRAYLAHARNGRQRANLVVHGQVFDAELTTFVETAERGRAGYEATFGLTHAQGRTSVLDMTYSEGGQTWKPDDLGRLALDHLLGKSGGPAPRHVALPSPLDWRAVEARAGGIPELVATVGSLLVTERAVTDGIFARVHVVEVRLVGPPRAVAVRVRGSRATGHGSPPVGVESAIEVLLT